MGLLSACDGWWQQPPPSPVVIYKVQTCYNLWTATKSWQKKIFKVKSRSRFSLKSWLCSAHEKWVKTGDVTWSEKHQREIPHWWIHLFLKKLSWCETVVHNLWLLDRHKRGRMQRLGTESPLGTENVANRNIFHFSCWSCLSMKLRLTCFISKHASKRTQKAELISLFTL